MQVKFPELDVGDTHFPEEIIEIDMKEENVDERLYPPMVNEALTRPGEWVE